MKMKGMIANAPSYCALFICSCALVGLTFNAEIHDVVSADSAVVHHYIPCPESDSIPLESC